MEDFTISEKKKKCNKTRNFGASWEIMETVKLSRRKFFLLRMEVERESLANFIVTEMSATKKVSL